MNLCCPRNSQESSPAPQFESINSLALCLHCSPTLTSIHDYRKNHSFDYTDLCQQSDVSAFNMLSSFVRDFQVVREVKNPLANAGNIRDIGSIPGSGRSPGEEHDNPLQYSCLENPMDRGARQATVHGIAKSQTRLK